MSGATSEVKGERREMINCHLEEVRKTNAGKGRKRNSLLKIFLANKEIWGKYVNFHKSSLHFWLFSSQFSHFRKSLSGGINSKLHHEPTTSTRTSTAATTATAIKSRSDSHRRNANRL